MDGTKHPLASLGIMAPLVALVVLICNRFWPGLGITDASASGYLDMIDTVFGLVLAIIGRARATKQIAFSIALAFMLSGTVAGCTNGAYDPTKAHADFQQALLIMRDAGCLAAIGAEAAAPIVQVAADPAGGMVLQLIGNEGMLLCSAPASGIVAPAGTQLGTIIPLPPAKSP